MRRAVNAFTKAIGLNKALPSAAEAATTTGGSGVSAPAGRAAATASPTARLDQALADIANIAAKARERSQESHPKAAPPPLQATAAELPSSRPSGLPSDATATQKQPALTGVHAQLAKTNRDLHAERDGKQLASLAQTLYNGSGGVKKDVVRASKLWVLAAGKGDLTSVLTVGLASIDGCGAIPRDWQRARGILSQLADKAGHPWAHFALATLLLRRKIAEATGEAIPTGATATPSSSTPSTASSSASLDLSLIPPPLRTHPDCIAALGSYHKAAESNAVPPAWLNLANCYAYGIGCVGSDAAIHASGATASGGMPDPVQAAHWLRHAATKGDPIACASYAHALQTGGAGGLFAVPVDEKEAGVWWRQAAVGGHPAAQHNLGCAYMRGQAPGCENGKPDHPAALIWFRRAAQAGVVRAALNAGLLLERGAEGVERDLAGAATVLTQAMAALQRQQTAASGAASRDRDRALSLLAKRAAAVRRKLTVLSSGPQASRAPAVDDGDEDAAEYDLVLEFDSPSTRDAFLRSMHQTAANGAGDGDLTAGTVLDVLKAYTQPQQQQQQQGVASEDGADKQKGLLRKILVRSKA